MRWNLASPASATTVVSNESARRAPSPGPSTNQPEQLGDGAQGEHDPPDHEPDGAGPHDTGRDVADEELIGGYVGATAYGYKVVEVREKMTSGKMSGEKLLNEHGRQGWQLKAITATEVKERLGPGGVQGLLVTFERVGT